MVVAYLHKCVYVFLFALIFFPWLFNESVEDEARHEFNGCSKVKLILFISFVPLKLSVSFFFGCTEQKEFPFLSKRKKIQHPLYVECGCSQLVTLCTLHNLCYNIKISRIVIDGEVITVSGSIPQIVVDKHVIHTEGKNAKAFQTESTRTRTVINVQIESIQSWEAIVCRFYWCHK